MSDFTKVAEINLENYRRPVIKIQGVDALIDTGAVIPMFYFPPKILEESFNGIDLIFEEAKVSGIGNGEVRGKYMHYMIFI